MKEAQVIYLEILENYTSKLNEIYREAPAQRLHSGFHIIFRVLREDHKEGAIIFFNRNELRLEFLRGHIASRAF